MPDEKLTARLNLRLEPALYDVALKLSKHREAKDASEYMRGLLVMDALNAGFSLRGVEIPSWLPETYVDISVKPDLRREIDNEHRLLNGRLKKGEPDASKTKQKGD